MFKLCSLPDICQHSVQTPYPGFSVLVFVFVKWISESIEVFKVFMIPNSNQQVCQHFFKHYPLFPTKKCLFKEHINNLHWGSVKNLSIFAVWRLSFEFLAKIGKLKFLHQSSLQFVSIFQAKISLRLACELAAIMIIINMLLCSSKNYLYAIQWKEHRAPRRELCSG